ncbi:MAG: hypothetical protein MZV70_52685 [Desulfobacterales bacterium]|nr:hypothetical protein [Desulfobacterales bacterium]
MAYRFLRRTTRRPPRSSPAGSGTSMTAGWRSWPRARPGRSRPSSNGCGRDRA